MDMDVDVPMDIGLGRIDVASVNVPVILRGNTTRSQSGGSRR